MNILVSNISTFSYQTINRKYRVCVPNCCVEELSAYHTNESILKCVVELENVKLTGGLNRIIALVSDKALTTADDRFENRTSVEYYSDKANELCSNVEIVLVKIEDDNNKARDISAILSDICKNIQTNDVVYIDSAGGLRTINNVVQILTKILKYKGIENPCTLYSDIQNDSFITDTSSFNKITDLADAFNEFMTTGKADQLQQCFSSVENKEPYSSLVQSMVDFSDHIRLGNVEKLDSVINRLSGDIQNCMADDSMTEMERVIVRQFLPVIEDKLIGNQKEGVDYVRIIDWCITNKLIQQALTLFVEKMPIYIFDKKIIKFKGDIDSARREYKKKRKEGPNASEWEVNAFYTEILQDKETKPGQCKAALEPYVIEFVDLLNKKGRADNVSSKVKDAYRTLLSFRKDFPDSYDRSLMADRIRMQIEKHHSDNFWSFANSIKNEPTTIADILDLENLSKGNSNTTTLAKKIEAISRLEKEGCINPEFTFKIMIDKVVALYYAYVYAKALRNKINHASSEENLNDSQKSILETYGYDFSKEDIKTIAKNMILAVQTVKDAEDSLKPVVKSDMPKKETEYSIHHSLGDKVRAKAVGTKTVVLDGYDYEVQLVLPKGHKPIAMGLEITVVIKQISKNGKITQVTL